jgi:hypothetical protein
VFVCVRALIPCVYGVRAAPVRCVMGWLTQLLRIAREGEKRPRSMMWFVNWRVRDVGKKNGAEAFRASVWEAGGSSEASMQLPNMGGGGVQVQFPVGGLLAWLAGH